jgi:lipopolysaccharide transport system permease protein
LPASPFLVETRGGQTAGRSPAVIALVQTCYRFRELLGMFITRELRARFRGSIFGSAWIVLQPLCFLLVFAVVFEQFMEAGIDPALRARRPGFFVLSMFCGLVPWIAFAETLNRGANCIFENGNLIKKFAFPSEILPAYLVGVSLVSTTVGFALVAGAVGVFHGEWPHHLHWLPVALLLQGAFTLGLVFLASAAAVFIRDVQQLLPMLLNFLFFLSPVFLFGRFPARPVLAGILRANPLSYLMEAYRAIFVYHPEDLHLFAAAGDEVRSAAFPAGEAGPGRLLLVFGAAAVVILLLGYRVFLKLKPRFADEV